MKNSTHKLAVALAAFALLLPGAIIICSAPSASAATTYGRVSVSGTNLLVNGAVPSQKFFGVDDTTALQFAILAYIEGQTQYAGKCSVFNGPDTSNQGTIPYHATADQFWQQYFALCAYYNCNLIRIGAGDQWGSGLQYDAWVNHHDAYLALLKDMCSQAESHGVWICLVLAGSQEYPTYSYGGTGTVFQPGTSSYNNYITYARGVMTALDGQNAIAMYDLFNEPDHDKVWANYWSSNGGKTAYHTWACDVAVATAGASTHPRTMGTAGLGAMFGWGQADFDLATGTVPFEIADRHYYASASDSTLFSQPEQWARNDGKPLLWSELGYNAVYPLTRWAFGEQAIWAAGGQAITSMVLTGTSGYPYTGALLPVPVSPPVPPPAPPELKFTSSPVINATVGTQYTYKATTSVTCTFALTTDAAFLSTSSDGAVTGTPNKAGTYSVSIRATSSDARTVYQNYSLTVPAPPAPPAPPPVNGGNSTNGTGTTGGSNGTNGSSGTSGNTTSNTTGGSSSGSQGARTNSRWSSWWGHFFGGLTPSTGTARSSTYAPSTPVQATAPAPRSNGYLMGGSDDAALLGIALVTLASLAGAFLVLSRRRR